MGRWGLMVAFGVAGCAQQGVCLKDGDCGQGGQCRNQVCVATSTGSNAAAPVNNALGGLPSASDANATVMFTDLNLGQATLEGALGPVQLPQGAPATASLTTFQVSSTTYTAITTAASAGQQVMGILTFEGTLADLRPNTPVPTQDGRVCVPDGSGGWSYDSLARSQAQVTAMPDGTRLVSWDLAHTFAGATQVARASVHLLR